MRSFGNLRFSSRLYQVDSSKTYREIAKQWGVLAAFIWLATHPLSDSIAGSLLMILLIASRVGVLINLSHEGSHGFLHPRRARNDWIAKWFLAYPIGIYYEVYQEEHARHHAFAAMNKDVPSDLEKYTWTDLSRWDTYVRMLHDLFGITALRVFFGYLGWNKQGRVSSKQWKATCLGVLKILFSQTLIFSIFFMANPQNYLLYWIFPLMGPHMLLMRVRGIAEHGLAKQKGIEIKSSAESLYYTRSVLTKVNPYQLPLIGRVEKFIWGHLNIQYHHEHHLFPRIPAVHLPEVHELVREYIATQNPDAYESGYLKAAFHNLREKRPLLRPQWSAKG